MTEYNTREDGEEYASPVLFETTCGYCGASITNRTEGRPRKYCDSTCRSGAYRRSKPRRTTKMGLKKTKRS